VERGRDVEMLIRVWQV